MKDRAAAGVLAFLLVAAVLSLWLVGPPAVVGRGAPADVFSAERAHDALAAFAVRPHPMGSDEHARVRDYIIAELTRLGLTPEIQRTTAVNERYPVAGTVENIVARLRGTDAAGGALLLACHYDSVPAGPGAGDDGAGVVTLLETLRALRAGPPLKNDLIFLIDDGEEDGLLGASAFVAEHRWAKDVRLALNFEARGNTGASQMFETSEGNGLLVQELARAVAHPAATSLSYEIYRRMPNDTDMTVFKAHGLAGLNFAFIGHVEAYHTPLDNAAALDRRSLQQHGSYALALARRFGNRDLSLLRAPDAVYFGFPGGLFVHYPGRWSLRLGIAAALLALAAIVLLVVSRKVSVMHAVLGLAVTVGVALAMMLAAWGALQIVTLLHARVLPDGDIAQSRTYLVAVVAVTVALHAALLGWARRKLPGESIAVGAMLVLVLLAFATARWVPGGSYLFVWPLVFLAVASVVPRASWRGVVPLCLLALPAVGLLVPIVWSFHQAMGLAPRTAPAYALLVAVLLGALTPQLEYVLAEARRRFVWTAAGLGLVFLVLGAATTRYGRTHPRPSMLLYALDADANKAEWASNAARADAWTAQFVGAAAARSPLDDFLPWRRQSWLVHDAPVLSLSAPEVVVDADSTEGDTRTLVLLVRAPRHARQVTLWAPDREVLAAWVNDRAVPTPRPLRWNPDGRWALRYVNVPDEGIRLRLRVKGAAPLKLVAVAGTPGRPDAPGHAYTPRPPETMPQHGGDETLVRRSLTL